MENKSELDLDISQLLLSLKESLIFLQREHEEVFESSVAYTNESQAPFKVKVVYLAKAFNKVEKDALTKINENGLKLKTCQYKVFEVTKNDFIKDAFSNDLSSALFLSPILFVFCGLEAHNFEESIKKHFSHACFLSTKSIESIIESVEEKKAFWTALKSSYLEMLR
jgi:hypothetical protein